jgi:hypothetical protein
MEGAMEAAAVYEGEVYTLHNLPQIIKAAPKTKYTGVFERISEEKTVKKLLDKISEKDIKNIYLALLKSVLEHM